MKAMKRHGKSIVQDLKKWVIDSQNHDAADIFERAYVSHKRPMIATPFCIG